MVGDIKKKDDGSKCEIKYVGDIVIDHRSSFIYLLHLSFAQRLVISLCHHRIPEHIIIDLYECGY